MGLHLKYLICAPQTFLQEDITAGMTGTVEVMHETREEYLTVSD